LYVLYIYIYNQLVTRAMS